VLAHDQLMYYRGEADATPRRTVPLTNCVLVDEGYKIVMRHSLSSSLTRKKPDRPMYRVFSLWAIGTLDSARGPASGALLRVSTADVRSADQWMGAIEAATGQPLRTINKLSNVVDSPLPPPRRTELVGLKDGTGVGGEEDGSSGALGGVTHSPALSSTAPDAAIFPTSAACADPPPIATAVAHAIDTPLSGGGASLLEGTVNLNPDLPPILVAEVGGGGAASPRIVRTNTNSSDGDGGSGGGGGSDYRAGGGGVGVGEETSGQPPTPRRRQRKAFDPNLFPASRPMHHSARPSMLSAGVEPHPDMAGFVNLLFLLFTIVHFRLLLENFRKHGLLIKLDFLSPATAANVIDPIGTPLRLLLSASSLVMPCFAAFLLERLAVVSPSAVRFVNPMHALNIFASLAFPCALVKLDLNYGAIGGGILLLLGAVTIFLKLISWAHFHHDIREADKESRETITDAPEEGAGINASLAKFATNIADTDGESLHYPNNVTLSNLGYFLVAPTLCYQLEFPRTTVIRQAYLLSLSIRLLVLWALVPVLCVQYMLPLLEASKLAVQHGDVVGIVDNVLRLSLPVTYCWLTGFYAFFHVWLNLLAEVTRFGDRAFYKAWWNATDFDGYWRMWNLPVHNWVVRHAYFPIQRRVTRSRTVTGFLCFTLSAALHEIIVAFPLNSFYMPLAFLGMIMQVLQAPWSLPCLMSGSMAVGRFIQVVQASMLSHFYVRLNY